MNKSEMFGFTLESDDRTEEEKAQQREQKKSGGACGDCSGQESPTAPMDTDYHEEMEEHKPKMPMFNLNFDKGIRGKEREGTKSEGKRFNIKRLFEAVASRDVTQLEGLHTYLHQNLKKLSDSSYQSYGKTPLMKALLHLKDGKNETVELLLDISEKMGDIQVFVNKAYTNSYYKGQTALHIAIERRSLSYVKLLVSKGADVHARAYGKFFQPHDGPNFYFGELPLSLAACTNQPEVVDFLMTNEKERANSELVDSQGNTVLHALVVIADNSPDNTEFITNMYDRILKTTASLHPKLKLEEIENQKGLTPLKMAARTGKIELFSYLLQREFHESGTKHLSRKFTEWVYGPVTCSLYDLASVDSYEENSVLQILVYCSDIPNRHNMLDMEPLNRLMDWKWKKFAGPMFAFNFLVYILYLMIFTVVAYNKQEKVPFIYEEGVWGYLYVSGLLLTALANLYFFVIGILDLRRKSPKLKTLLVDGYYEILFFVQGVFFMISAGFYLSGRDEYLTFLVVCLALSWVNVLYFSRGDSHMGVYSIMIQKMILSDILHFLFVYVVFLFGFSAAVVTLLIKPQPAPTTTPPPTTPTRPSSRMIIESPVVDNCYTLNYTNISHTMLQLFKFTIGMGDMEFTQDTKYMEIFYVLLICYIILTYILLLNMLIALMNRTVERTAMESTCIWKLQRAITILDMERRLPCCLRERFRCGVEKNLCTGDGRDLRQCFRVEEVNWNKWNISLGKIDEDPGCWDRVEQPSSDDQRDRPNPGRSRRSFFRVSRRQTYQSTEMSPLSITPV